MVTLLQKYVSKSFRYFKKGKLAKNYRGDETGMAIVKDETFYHIQYLRPNVITWKSGETYTIGNVKNTFSAYYDTYNFVSQNGNIDALEIIKYMREYFFEQVRREKYPSKPSRNKSLWLIQNSQNLPNALNFWIGQLMTNGVSFRTIKLKCSGCVHYANQSFLKNYPQHVPEICNDATQYWEGVNASPEDINTEVLFTGKVAVESIIDPFNP